MIEIVDAIEWTPEMRARVYPSRRIANPALVTTQLSQSRMMFPIDDDEARALARYPVHPRVEDAMVDVARNPASWRPAVERAIARAGEPLAGPPEVDVEAATVALQFLPLYAAMPYWLSAGGIPFALRVLIRCHGIVNADRLPGGAAFLLETRKHSVGQPSNHADAWLLLRGMLADAVEPVYDECHGIADEARLRVRRGKPAECGLALMLAFAFPDEPAWAQAVAKSALALTDGFNELYVDALARYIAVAPAEVAVELLTRVSNTALDEGDLITALAHHGAATGVKIYQAALKRAGNDALRKHWGSDLLAVRTTDAGKALARLARGSRGARVFATLASKHRLLMLQPKVR
jgi:hypothetical protein